MSAASALGDCRYLSLFEASGYAVAAKRCLLALVNAGVSVTWLPFVRSFEWGLGYAPARQPAVGDAELDPLIGGARDPNTVVAHLMPEYYPRVRERFPDAVLVGHTVWETDRLPAHWPALLEVPDVLVVPCRWNAEVIAAAGVRTPVVVVPHAAAPPMVVAASETWAGIPADAFVFYTIAPWTRRKAVWSTVQAYLTAFTASDRVLLVVKTSPRDFTHAAAATSAAGPGTSAYAIARLMSAQRRPAPLLLVTGDLSESDMAALHTRGGCFVSLSRAEGWGLGSFDAATYGNPVVTTGFGGHLDYVDASLAYLVDYELVPVDPAGAPSYTSEQMWAEPSVAQGAALLRQVFSDPARASGRAGELATRIKERYDATSIARLFIDGVAPHLPQASRRIP